MASCELVLRWVVRGHVYDRIDVRLLSRVSDRYELSWSYVRRVLQRSSRR